MLHELEEKCREKKGRKGKFAKVTKDVRRKKKSMNEQMNE